MLLQLYELQESRYLLSILTGWFLKDGQQETQLCPLRIEVNETEPGAELLPPATADAVARHDTYLNGQPGEKGSRLCLTHLCKILLIADFSQVHISPIDFDRMVSERYSETQLCPLPNEVKVFMDYDAQIPDLLLGVGEFRIYSRKFYIWLNLVPERFTLPSSMPDKKVVSFTEKFENEVETPHIIVR